MKRMPGGRSVNLIHAALVAFSGELHTKGDPREYALNDNMSRSFKLATLDSHIAHLNINLINYLPTVTVMPVTRRQLASLESSMVVTGVKVAKGS